MCLFAGRLSTAEMKANQLRLYFSALAYTLMETLRWLALKGTGWAQAKVDIRQELAGLCFGSEDLSRRISRALHPRRSAVPRSGPGTR
jgi:hypothetical protein